MESDEQPGNSLDIQEQTSISLLRIFLSSNQLVFIDNQWQPGNPNWRTKTARKLFIDRQPHPGNPFLEL